MSTKSPQSRLYCLCINDGSLFNGLAMYFSCDRKKFHDNESTHILHNFWTSTHRGDGGVEASPPSSLAAPLPTACCVVVDAACLYAVSTSSACRRALMSLCCQRSLRRSSVPHAASRTACRCAGIPPDRRCAHARSPRTSALGRPCTWPRSVPDRRAHTAPSTPSPSYTSRSLRATHLQTCTHSCVCVCVCVRRPVADYPLGRIGSCLRPGMVRGPGPFIVNFFILN